MSRGIHVLGVAGLCALATVLSGCGAGDVPAPGGPAPSTPAAAVRQEGPAEPPRVPPGRELPSLQRALAMRGLVVGANGEETAAYAGAICTEIERGTSVEQVVVDVQQGTATTLNDAGYVLGAAVSSFCPQHLARLPR